MAGQVNENVNVKVNVDTKQFDSSFKGMKQELRELQKTDLTLLSPEESKAALQRMGDLKAGIKDFSDELNQVDTGNFFGSFSTLSGPAIASISALSIGMDMFGLETEKVENIQRKMMATIGILSSLQTIADTNKLKSLVKALPLQAQDLKNRITNTLLIKQETKAIIQKNVAEEASASSIKKITILQKAWNKAVSANPILLIVAAVAALVTGIVLLTKAFRKNTEEAKESEKALDGVVIKDEELREAHNETIRTIRDFDLEMQHLNGTISDQEYELTQLQYKYEDLARGIEDKYLPAQEEAERKSFGFWNSLKNSILSIGNPYGALIKNSVDYGERIIEIEGKISAEMIEIQKREEAERELILERQEKKRIDDIEQANQKILNLSKSLSDARVKDETLKLKMIRDARIKDIQDSKADIEVQTEAIKQVWTTYYNDVSNLEKKYTEDRKKELEKLVEDTRKAQIKLEEAQFGEDKLARLEEDYQKQLDLLDERLKREEIKYEDAEKQKNEITKSYLLEKETIELKAQEEKHKKLLDFQKNYLDKTIEQQREAELALIEKEGAEAGASPEEIAQAKYKIEKKYIDLLTDYRNSEVYDRYQTEIDAQIQALDTKMLNEQEYLEARDAILEQYSEKEKQRQELKDQSIQLGHHIAMEGINMIAERQKAAYQNQLNLIDGEFSAEQEKIDKLLKYQQISELEAEQMRTELDEERAKKEKELAIEQAKKDKKLALFQIAIDTAAAVVKALPNVVLTAFAAATGAASAISVSSKPLPTFRVGSEEPFEETGNAYLHKGEMVVRPEGVSYSNNEEVIRRLNDNPYTDLSRLAYNAITFDTMIEYIDLSLQRYNKIPVVLNVNELNDTNSIITNIEATSEV